MPETEELVINTGPLLALIAGVGDLSLLELLYKRVLVSFEVCQEIEAGGSSGFGVSEFNIKGRKPQGFRPIRSLLYSGKENIMFAIFSWT